MASVNKHTVSGYYKKNPSHSPGFCEVQDQGDSWLISW